MVDSIEGSTLLSRKNTRWSDEDDRKLLDLVVLPQFTQWEIAHALGRTEAAVSSRLTIIKRRKMTKRGAKK